MEALVEFRLLYSAIVPKEKLLCTLVFVISSLERFHGKRPNRGHNTIKIANTYVCIVYISIMSTEKSFEM